MAARVGRNEPRELRRMHFGRSAGYSAARLTHPTQTISRFTVNGVAFDVGTRSRRRASQPRPGGSREPVSEPGAFFALGEFGSRPVEARSAGGVGGSGVCFLLVTFLCTSKEK